MADFRTQITSTRQLAISIQDARTAKDMTQTELAEATGIPRPGSTSSSKAVSQIQVSPRS